MPHLYFMLRVGTVFFSGDCKPWCAMTLSEFLVARVVTVQAPKDSLLKFELLVCNWKDLVSNLPET